MKSRSASRLWLCLALMALGCAKGDSGPTGPKGDTGAANVICSAWHSPSTWDAENEFGVALRTYAMPDTALTQEIIDQGVVLVYMRFVGLNSRIIQLPFVAVSPAYSFSFRAGAGSIKVVYYDAAAPATTPGIIPSGNQIRYVLIPGGALAASMQANGSTYEQETANLESRPYADMCREYDFPE